VASYRAHGWRVLSSSGRRGLVVQGAAYALAGTQPAVLSVNWKTDGPLTGYVGRSRCR